MTGGKPKVPERLSIGFYGGSERRLYGIRRYVFPATDAKGVDFEVWVDLDKLAELLPKMRKRKLRMARKGAVMTRRSAPTSAAPTR